MKSKKSRDAGVNVLCPRQAERRADMIASDWQDVPTVREDSPAVSDSAPIP